jgi:NADPH-dependent 2,4-dienoyl-CoA reductase/sulfur reductase-like enzyme
MKAAGIVVIGAGQAGGRLVEALRGNGYDGRLALIGAEPHPPYERPALSKEALLDGPGSIVWVRPAGYYAEAGIELRPGVEAVAIDRAARRIKLADGASLPYGALALATGARPRPLAIPGADHPACRMLRTVEDSLALRAELVPGARIVIIGAGFIGLEVAAVARQRDCRVTVLDIAETPLCRAVPPEIGRHFAALHRGRGVDLRLATGVAEIADAAGAAVVVTSDGAHLPADLVLVAIGILPNVEMAAACGLAVENGILVDEFGRTDDPAIWAAGDVTNHWNPRLGRRLRLESWQNAQNQAIAVAHNLLGRGEAYAEIPWFWSDQWEINLQIAGLPDAGDEVIRRGRLETGAALHLHLREGRLAALVGVNAGRDMRVAREIMSLGREVPATAFADPATKLADLYRALKARA